MIPDKKIKEQLSKAYAISVASYAGYNYSVKNDDYGDDLLIHHVQRIDGGVRESGASLRIQLKCTENWRDFPDEISYDLKVKNYKDLIRESLGDPLILMVLLVPKKKAKWLIQTPNSLVLHKIAFWIYLEGGPTTTNDKTIAIRIPKKKIFNVDNLNLIFDTIITGGDLHSI